MKDWDQLDPVGLTRVPRLLWAGILEIDTTKMETCVARLDRRCDKGSRTAWDCEGECIRVRLCMCICMSP